MGAGVRVAGVGQGRVVSHLVIDLHGGPPVEVLRHDGRHAAAELVLLHHLPVARHPEHVGLEHVDGQGLG